MPTDDPSWFDNLAILGRSQGFLTYAQVNTGMPRAIVHPHSIEEIVDRLNRLGILVVPDSDEAVR
jgi:hypothetical protein